MHLSINIDDNLIDTAKKHWPDKSIQKILDEAISFYITSLQNQISQFWEKIEIEPET